MNYYTSNLNNAPDITLHVNCDAVLAINLRMFNMNESDEFIFTLKNYSYKDSPYVFIFRTKKADMDKNGEVFFKIPHTATRRLKPGAFYNLAVISGASDSKNESIYNQLFASGRVVVAYGAQDLVDRTSIEHLDDYEILNIRLEPTEAPITKSSISITGELIGMRLELID